MRIMFLNPTPQSGVGYDPSKIEKQLNEMASPGTKIEIGFPEDYMGSQVVKSLSDASNLNGLHHMMQTASLVRQAKWAEENGFDAVIQSNTFDPGVEGARLAVRIPVIGLLKASLHTATMLADKIGVVVPLASHEPYIRKLLRTYSMEGFVSGVGAIGVYGDDIASREEEITGITIDLIKDLKKGGAQIILPLGGLLIPYVVDPKDLTEATGAPVLNTKAIGISVAELCVRMGWSQSPICYPPGELTYEDFGKAGYGGA